MSRVRALVFLFCFVGKDTISGGKSLCVFHLVRHLCIVLGESRVGIQGIANAEAVSLLVHKNCQGADSESKLLAANKE